MAEKVARTGITREKDFLYYVKGGAVWKVPMKKPGATSKGKSEKVVDAGISMEDGYMYFVDKDGDVARAKRAVGGQKRKGAKAAKKATRKPARKAAGKKKGGAKKKKAGGKKGGKKGRR